MHRDKMKKESKVEGRKGEGDGEVRERREKKGRKVFDKGTLMERVRAIIMKFVQVGKKRIDGEKKDKGEDD